jgi:hypothetical protein
MPPRSFDFLLLLLSYRYFVDEGKGNGKVFGLILTLSVPACFIRKESTVRFHDQLTYDVVHSSANTAKT